MQKLLLLLLRSPWQDIQGAVSRQFTLIELVRVLPLPWAMPHVADAQKCMSTTAYLTPY